MKKDESLLGSAVPGDSDNKSTPIAPSAYKVAASIWEDVDWLDDAEREAGKTGGVPMSIIGVATERIAAKIEAAIIAHRAEVLLRLAADWEGYYSVEMFPEFDRSGDGKERGRIAASMMRHWAGVLRKQAAEQSEAL
jgi:hypothetical protein